MNAVTPLPLPVPDAVPLVQPAVRQKPRQNVLLSQRFTLGRRAAGPLAVVAPVRG